MNLARNRTLTSNNTQKIRKSRRIQQVAAISFSAIASISGAFVLNGIAHANPRSAESESSIALNATGLRFGDYLTFTTNQSGKIKLPMIKVHCYQNGVMVYLEAGTNTTSFQLGGGSSDWVQKGGGAANCVADLYYNQETPRQAQPILATMTFEAGA
jgi:hypothetical protein